MHQFLITLGWNFRDFVAILPQRPIEPTNPFSWASLVNAFALQICGRKDKKARSKRLPACDEETNANEKAEEEGVIKL